MSDYESRARELLAEELDLMSPTLADDVRAGNEKKRSPTAAALRAIARALEQPASAAGVEGWKLVPVEPTEAMVAAASAECERMRGVIDPVIHVWDAMLPAAPKPEDAS